MCTSDTSGAYAKYRPYIGVVGLEPRYIQVGHGWSCSFKTEYGSLKGYSFTYQGIEKYIKSHHITAQYCHNTLSLNTELQRLETNQSKAFVIATEVLNIPYSIENHVMSLFAQKREDRLLLFMNDSNGSDYPLDEVRKAIKVDCVLQIFASRVRRQQRGYVCQTFAIRDCKRFNKEPNLIERMLKMNGYSDEKGDNDYDIDKLPKSLLVDTEKIEKTGQKYFSSLVAHLDNA